MNLTGMRTRFLDLVDDTSGTYWSPSASYTRVDRYLNAAKDWMVSVIQELDENLMITSSDISVTAAATSEFTSALPSDFRKFISCERLVTGANPRKLAIKDFRDRYTPVDDTLVMMGYDTGPVVSYRASTLVVVNPTEAFTLRLWYLKRLADMSAGSEILDYPIEYHELICLVAAKMARASATDTIEQAAYLGTIEKEMRDIMRKTLGPRNAAHAQLIRGL